MSSSDSSDAELNQPEPTHADQAEGFVFVYEVNYYNNNFYKQLMLIFIYF